MLTKYIRAVAPRGGAEVPGPHSAGAEALWVLRAPEEPTPHGCCPRAVPVAVGTRLGSFCWRQTLGRGVSVDYFDAKAE